jgi:hypothetical protein
VGDAKAKGGAPRQPGRPQPGPKLRIDGKRGRAPARAPPRNLERQSRNARGAGRAGCLCCGGADARAARAGGLVRGCVRACRCCGFGSHPLRSSGARGLMALKASAGNRHYNSWSKGRQGGSGEGATWGAKRAWRQTDEGRWPPRVAAARAPGLTHAHTHPHTQFHTHTILDGTTNKACVAVLWGWGGDPRAWPATTGEQRRPQHCHARATATARRTVGRATAQRPNHAPGQSGAVPGANPDSKLARSSLCAEHEADARLREEKKRALRG